MARIAELVEQEMTIRFFSRLGVASVMIVAHGCTMAQNPQKNEARPSVDQEKAVVTRNLRTFLNSWLVNGDLGVAMQAFGTAAYRNEAILQEPCAGYIKPEQKSSQDARRIGIRKFLQDFLPSTPVQRLGQVLNESAAVRLGAQLGAVVANNPEADGFVLAKLGRDQIPTGSSEVTDYLRSRLPAELYVAFVPIDNGTVYFLWVREGSSWCIFHASLVCV
jgi:hypothetical protein